MAIKGMIQFKGKINTNHKTIKLLNDLQEKSLNLVNRPHKHRPYNFKIYINCYLPKSKMFVL